MMMMTGFNNDENDHDDGNGAHPSGSNTSVGRAAILYGSVSPFVAGVATSV